MPASSAWLCRCVVGDIIVGGPVKFLHGHINLCEDGFFLRLSDALPPSLAADLASLDERGRTGNGGGAGSEDLAGKPACIQLARRATQLAAMPEHYFCSPKRPSHRALEPEAMVGVLQGGDGERMCGVVLAWCLGAFK